MSDGIHKAMLRVLCKFNEGLKIVHFNARSLNHDKMDYVRYVFDDLKVDVICVTETWFNDNLPDATYAISGYTLYRNDRSGKRGGGVAIYTRSDLKSKLICNSSGSLLEFINVEISGSPKLLISCVYNPHRHNSVEPFFHDLTSRLLAYDYYTVCGDFNINLLKDDSLSTDLIHRVGETGLNIVNKLFPTRFDKSSADSLLDLFLVSDLTVVNKYDQISFISDHDLIFCDFDIPLRRNASQKLITYRDFNKINVDNLFADLASVNWCECWSFLTVDDKVDWFLSIVNNLFNVHVPVRTVSKAVNSIPWFTPLVLLAIKKKNILHTRWKRSRTSSNWEAYIAARNASNLCVRSAKMRHFSSKLNPSLPSRQLWKNIRQLRISNKEVSSCSLAPDDLNEFFLSNHTTNLTFSDNLFSDQISSSKQVFNFSAVTESDLARKIMSISSNAVGYDGLPIRFVKLILPFVLPTLTHIVNHCFTTMKFPSVWKIATITPLAKKSNATVVGDFRPISIISALGKVLEMLMTEQITYFIEKNKLLSPLQSGFRSGHSCNTALLKILDDLRIPYDNNQLSLLCLLDFSKAFDSVNHKLLCVNLKYKFNFSNHAIKLMESYLTRRVQRVCVDHVMSDFKEILCGVPQGSALGPLLFTLFINDLFLVCGHATMHAYADDVQLYISDDFGSLNKLVNVLNKDLDSIYQWATNNGLTINAKKSLVLPISYRRCCIADIPPILVGQGRLLCVNSARNLGFVINSKLSCTDHLAHVISKIYYVLSSLRISACYTPIAIKRNLVLQLIMPHIQYFSTVYSKLDSVSCSRLNVVFNNVTRYVFSISSYEHISLLRTKILGVDVMQYLEIRNLIFLYELLNTKTPDYLYTKLLKCRSVRTQILIAPKFNHLCSSRLFFVNAIRLWNSLPLSLRAVTTRRAFRGAIYIHYSSSS